MCLKCKADDPLRKVEKVTYTSTFDGIHFKAEYNCYRCDSCKTYYFAYNDTLKNELLLCLELLKPTKIKGLRLAFINCKIGREVIFSDLQIVDALEEDGLSRDNAFGRLILERYETQIKKLLG